MSQADTAPSTGAPIVTGGKNEVAAAVVISLDSRRPARLRADVPPFDPRNPAHLRAWESLYDFGRRAMEAGA